jgi:hypothetical protein
LMLAKLEGLTDITVYAISLAFFESPTYDMELVIHELQLAAGGK